MAAYNLGTDEVSDVEHIGAARSAATSGVDPRIEHTGGTRGWIGDSPLIHLDCSRAAGARLAAELTIAQAVERTLDWFDANEWVFETRGTRVSVIFTRAPLRISLGGGGTDLPSYYRAHGGFLIAGAIDKYVYMLTHTVFQRRFRLKYSEFEEVTDPRRSATRSCARRSAATGPAARWRSPRWPTSPPGTGLGSSGSFTVCLLKALQPGGAHVEHPGAIAEAACHIEIDVLGEPLGQAGPVRRRPRRHLRLHLPPGRLGRRSSRCACPPRPSRA